jgi:RNA polymerase sigma-70 factor (ECF subfamily)
LETLLAEQAESPSGCAARREDEILLADTLAQMPADYRDVIVLRHIEGLSFEDVALRMDRSAGAVRMLWLRALKKMREALKSES